MKNAPLRHRLEHAAYLGVRWLLRRLPHEAARPLGRRIGDLAWLVLGSRRRVALRNLAIAYPERSAAERRRLARGCFQSLGAALTDTLSATRFDLVRLCRRVELEGWEHLRAIHAQGQGFFVLSAHLGHWEVAAHVAGAWAGPLSVVGRPLDNPHLDAELERLRHRFGNRLIPKRGAARGMLKALGQGGVVGILIDQRVREQEGILVPFFGRECPTSPVLARLSLRTGAPVVPIFCHPEPGGRYRFVARPAIRPPAADTEGDDETAVHTLTRAYLEATEREIDLAPERWMWMHDRFKGR
jgi:Kdo2-lipid IVA lauroyltransferase/acyltransferase